MKRNSKKAAAGDSQPQKKSQAANASAKQTGKKYGAHTSAAQVPAPVADVRFFDMPRVEYDPVLTLQQSWSSPLNWTGIDYQPVAAEANTANETPASGSANRQRRGKHS